MTGAIYPYLIGRFSFFDACDRNGIMRPTVLITEWGWTYDTVPSPAQALIDIRWAVASCRLSTGQGRGHLVPWGDTPGTIEDQTAAVD